MRACQPVVQQEPDHDLCLISAEKGKPDLTDSLNQHNVALNSSETSLEEKTVARRAATFGLGALQKQVSVRKPENLSFEVLEQALMQYALSAFHEVTEKKPDCLSVPTPTVMLGIF